MAAPNRIRVIVGDLVVSAYILPEADPPSDDKPVCKTCAPRRTKMVATCQVTVPHRNFRDVFDVYRCMFCMALWALPHKEVIESEVKP